MPGRSTLSNLINKVNNIIANAESNVDTGIIYIDITKAFDSINHEFLIAKLKGQYGIDGALLELIRMLIIKRSFSVSIGSQISPKRDIKSGIPQGGIISPLLFTLFINVISLLKHYQIVIYFYMQTT